jgi:type I restriction enzyme S subunit
MLKFKWEASHKEAEVGKIPMSWDEKRLDDFIFLESGDYFRFSEFVESGVRCLKIDNVGFGEVVWKTETFLPNNYISKYPELVLKEDDIVLALNRPIIDEKIKIGRVKKEDRPSILYQRVGKISLKNEGLNSRYLFFIFITEYFKQQLSASLVGTDQPYIRKPMFLDIKIPYPQPDEQSRIACVLSWFEDLIENKKRQNQILEKSALAIFKSWFIDFEPFKNGDFVDSELGKIPRGWRISKIGKELITILGGTPSRVNEMFWAHGTIPWIDSGKVNEFRIIEPTEYITREALENSATKLLPPRTTVLAITGATLGKVSLLEIASCANQSVVGILESASIPSEYIYFWIKRTIQDIISWQTGGAQQHINKNNVNESPLLLPNAAVLKEYQKIVKPIFDKVAVNERQILVLRRIRDTLLPLLVFGKLRVEEF